MKYVVWEADLCDDVQDDLYYGAALVEIHETKQAALDAVARYEQECIQKYAQEYDEHTVVIDGKEYRWMDLDEGTDDYDAGTRTFKYAPRKMYDFGYIWERFPERWVAE